MTQAPPPPPGDGWGSGPSGASTTSEERNWALAAHLGSIVAASIAMAFLAPLLVLLVKGNESAFVRRHAVESLNFQISMLVYGFVGGLLAVVVAIATVGFGVLVLLPLALLVLIAYVGCIVLASVRAANGEEFRYPLTFRLVR